MYPNTVNPRKKIKLCSTQLSANSVYKPIIFPSLFICVVVVVLFIYFNSNTEQLNSGGCILPTCGDQDAQQPTCQTILHICSSSWMKSIHVCNHAIIPPIFKQIKAVSCMSPSSNIAKKIMTEWN